MSIVKPPAKGRWLEFFIKSVVLLTKFSLEGLNNFYNRNNEERKTEGNKVLCYIKVSKAKEV